jgi:hypothetical protein
MARNLDSGSMRVTRFSRRTRAESVFWAFAALWAYAAWWLVTVAV